ncbi:MAG: hypothetical protein J0L76_03140, partial [Rhodobacterales bacterium]|nr:hypothetical protein [Rhodobacterales bacterium]
AGVLPAARFNDTAHGSRAGGALHAAATGAAAGFMAAADKVKLDAISGTNTGDQTIALTGDVTGSGTGSFAATIAGNAVTNAKLADVATGTIKGRATAGTGDPEDLTGAQATALLDTFTGSTKGLVPASGGGTTNFLRADGTFAAPPGGGGSPGGVSGKVQYNNAGAFAGAADMEIEGGQLRFPAIATPAAPASGGLKLFGQSLAGRMLPTCLGPSGLQSPLQPIISRSRIRLYVVVGNGGTDVNLGFALTTTGSVVAVNWAATNFRTRISWRRFGITTASATAVCGMRGNANMFTVGADIANAGGFYLAWTFSPGTGVANANHRLFVGMRSSTAAPTDVDPSSTTNMVGVGYDSADTNMQIMHNDGSGTATKINLGASFPKPSADATKAYRIELFSPPGTTQLVGYLLTDLETGATASGTVTTDLPSTTTGLNVYSQMSVGGTSSVVGLDHGLVYMETDN